MKLISSIIEEQCWVGPGWPKENYELMKDCVAFCFTMSPSGPQEILSDLQMLWTPYCSQLRLTILTSLASNRMGTKEEYHKKEDNQNNQEHSSEERVFF